MTECGKTLKRSEIEKALKVCARVNGARCPECPLYAYLDYTDDTCARQLLMLASAAMLNDELIISDLLDDFQSYVYGGVPNPAPYCSNASEKCVDARGWCKEDRSTCTGFAGKIGNLYGEVSTDDA